ncbi:MAG: hypothetical protein EOO13_09045 [Chitinophagaceae bacterium]|nr:MAG: hypothetical protein EOO13_09045 [Chitinophagaceae bacterium]
MKKIWKILWRIVLLLGLLYLVLLIPDGKKDRPLIPTAHKPFTWDNDSLWNKLEKDFAAARRIQPQQLDSALSALQQMATQQFTTVSSQRQAANSKSLDSTLHLFFSLGPLVAVNPGTLKWYASHYNEVRNYVKQQSQDWNMQDAAARNKVYSLLYGMRAALEEVILQSDSQHLPAAMPVKNEPSATPSTKIFGIEVHSGDLLVSRGGAEVSALISRGNDYPGNFSHVALLYVEEKTNQPFLIEAHIEKGVAVASVDEYEKDKKLRFMVMRPRSDLPAIKANPMLPHLSAKKMYEESFTRHIPYDFKMNFKDSSSMFCSEVASYAYKKNGLQLWPSLSTISSTGVVNWLHDFGVENFITQMPSDLEYDTQLSVVAEWRDPETLFKDHLDNAVMDAMLEQANKGVMIGYNTWQLPFVRIVKAYCVVKNWFGKTGIIPEGMRATTALKNQQLVALNKRVKDHVVKMSGDFQGKYNYRPPYWQLLHFARQGVNNP